MIKTRNKKATSVHSKGATVPRTVEKVSRMGIILLEKRMVESGWTLFTWTAGSNGRLRPLK
jgi:hypothetical protein